MDDAHVGRKEDSAVLLACRKTKEMIVLVDRAADSAETVVAAGKYIGKREFVQTGGPGCLDDVSEKG